MHLHHHKEDRHESRQSGQERGASGDHDSQDDDLSHALHHATNNASDHDSSLFKSALSKLSGKNAIASDFNEEEAHKHHRSFFGGHDQKHDQPPVKPDAQSLGSAAAMQALKMVTSGSGSAVTSKGGMKNQMVGLAMAQAAQLFDQQSAKGRAPTSTKQEVVTGAAQMAMTIMANKKMAEHGVNPAVAGAIGGALGQSSGLLNVASKLMG